MTATPDEVVNDYLGVDLLFRCDSCGAQAFAAAVKEESMLLFCGHHMRRHNAALEAQGWIVHDKTDLINKKPSVSANA